MEIIGVIFMLGFAYLVASFGIFLLSLLFGFTFTWWLAFKIWLALIIIKAFIG